MGRVHKKRLDGIDSRSGDVIVALDGNRDPRDLGQLTRFLLEKEPGSEIEVTRERAGAETATLRWKLEK